MHKSCLIIAGLLSAFAAHAQPDPDGPQLPIPLLQSRLSVAKTDTARLNLLIHIALAFLDSAESRPALADTALRYLSRVGSSPVTYANRRLDGWYQLTTARAYRAGGQSKHDSAIRHVLLALDILQPFRLDWAKACVEAAFIYVDARNSHEDSLQIAYYKKAIPIFSAEREQKWLAYTLQYLGGATKDPREALTYQHQALDIYRSLPNPDLRPLYSALAGSYSEIGDPQNALQYSLKAVRQEDGRPHPDQTSVLTYNQAAYTFANQGDYKQAAFYYGRSLEMAIRFADTFAILVDASGLVRADLNIGRYDSALAVRRRISRAFRPQTTEEQITEAENFAAIFQKMDRLDSLKPYIGTLSKLDSRLSSNDYTRRKTLPALASYYNRTGNFPLAKEYSRDLIRIGRLNNSIAAISTGYQHLSTADSALGNYRLAMQEYQRYIHLRDSLRDTDNARQVAALNLQYETEKKDKDIQALKHNQQLSNLALHQAGLTRNFIIAGSALLLILLLVTINRYRIKQRSNRQLSSLLSEKDVLLTEKEWLLKEIHHRVKNNLQIGISLLNLQSYHIENEKAQSAIRQSRNRMYAMSLIHQRLYQADNLKTIDMRQYIAQLIESIGDSYASEKEIDFRLAVQPLELDVEHALPVGLILNETVTNSLKYAFPNRRKGCISVILDQTADRITLSIADDGVGAPAGFELHRDHSMGMQLIDILVQQLDGSIQIDNCGGLAITIEFPRPNTTLIPTSPHRRPALQDS
ncbi:MAG TPA: histidine kinase dimerization/phosphoacceptor domain -containing protein [Puia sp.]|uniref:tetratricopeptide repeat-containing sensor histidine kinase n=1 Tax=Puia sp. TaxID=2045100 RepID=UPI002BD24FC6|nr:histidine kinase dimerization/phosphoacceptor domain -containing protein [Puia sp.]HVU98464.1 histidine kinase dimerization/phosphoacceptor domain -containing protein [Puia sp.]